MGWSTAALLLLALVFANLPFFTERIFFVRAAAGGVKALGWRLLELVVLYCIVGGAAWLMESRAGQVHPQRREFYAITVCLFLVLFIVISGASRGCKRRVSAMVQRKSADFSETLLGSEPVFDGVLLHARRDTVRLPNGKEAAREYIRHPGAVR